MAGGTTVTFDSARELLSGVLQLAPDAAGLHLVGWLQNGMTDAQATALCARQGVETTPLSRFVLDPVAHAVPQALLLSYAGFSDVAIRAAVRAMSDALA